jgi:GNAT superfamily N-acetyltransferase
MAEEVRDHDGYPVHLPAGDYLGFLVSDEALGTWVSEEDGVIIGHVALHRRSSAPVLDLASRALGLPADRLGVVARLMVDPGHRGRGIGRALLETATDASWERGLWPVLDVVADSAGAIALYERCGWTRAGEVTVTFRSGPTLEEAVFLGPVQRRGGGTGRDLG